MTKIVAVSGGFDPLHVGHLELLRAARALGDQLVVILNTDAWLRRKKGYVLMTWQHRAQLIEAYPFVDRVVCAEDDDGTVCRTLEKMQPRPTFFSNGGDRTKDTTPEIALCRRRGIEMRWNVGGGKTTSSSNLVQSACFQIVAGIVEAAGGQVIVPRRVLEDLIDLKLRTTPNPGDGSIEYRTE